MAAKYHKKVAVVIRPSNENKLGDLISRIGLEKRKIESFSDFQKVIESECDYENFEVILKKNRILTEKYLDIEYEILILYYWNKNKDESVEFPHSRFIVRCSRNQK